MSKCLAPDQEFWLVSKFMRVYCVSCASPTRYFVSGLEHLSTYPVTENVEHVLYSKRKWRFVLITGGKEINIL